MIFTYSEDKAFSREAFIGAWSVVDSDVRVFTWEDVMAQIESVSKRYLFARLLNKEAREDIAPFVFLREKGGLYVSSNIRPGVPDLILHLFDKLEHFDTITFFDSDTSNEEAPELLNFSILMRSEIPMPYSLLGLLFQNLEKQEKAEFEAEHPIGYELGELTGSAIIAKMFNRYVPSIRKKIKLEPASRKMGHPAFSVCEEFTTTLSKTEEIKHPMPSWLFARSRWDKARGLSILNRVKPPYAHEYLEKWNSAKELFLSTGPIEETDIRTLEMLVSCLEERSRVPYYDRSDVNNYMIKIDNAIESYNGIHDSFMYELTSRAVLHFINSGSASGSLPP